MSGKIVMSKDVLLQTRVPAGAAREVKRRARNNGDSDAAWLRRLLLDVTGEAEIVQPRSQSADEFFDLGQLFIRKSMIVAMDWIDPNKGSCASGSKPWELRVQLRDGSSLMLSTTPAKIVLKAFGLPHANPYPAGTEAARKAERNAR